MDEQQIYFFNAANLAARSSYEGDAEDWLRFVGGGAGGVGSEEGGGKLTAGRVETGGPEGAVGS
jgi:hypothetical protein